MAVLKRLDYSALSDDRIREALIKAKRAGMPTFWDYYPDTGNKLYEQLILFPGNDTVKQRRELYEFISNVYACALDVNTGKWRGKREPKASVGF